jgi:hypothetical protein
MQRLRRGREAEVRSVIQIAKKTNKRAQIPRAQMEGGEGFGAGKIKPKKKKKKKKKKTPTPKRSSMKSARRCFTFVLRSEGERHEGHLLSAALHLMGKGFPSYCLPDVDPPSRCAGGGVSIVAFYQVSFEQEDGRDRVDAAGWLERSHPDERERFPCCGWIYRVHVFLSSEADARAWMDAAPDSWDSLSRDYASKAARKMPRLMFKDTPRRCIEAALLFPTSERERTGCGGALQKGSRERLGRSRFQFQDCIYLGPIPPGDVALARRLVFGG